MYAEEDELKLIGFFILSFVFGVLFLFLEEWIPYTLSGHIIVRGGHIVGI